jgi:hypothetical protein
MQPEKLIRLPGDPMLAVDEMGYLRDQSDVPSRDFDGLRLRCVLDAMRLSSWDWPSAMFAIGGLDSDDEPTMYPGDRELEWLKSIAPDEDWSDFEVRWDT